jgi:hypothetical protein
MGGTVGHDDHVGVNDIEDKMSLQGSFVALDQTRKRRANARLFFFLCVDPQVLTCYVSFI